MLTAAAQLLSRVWLFEAPWTAACQAPLSSTVCWSLLRFMSIELVMLFNHLILHHPFSFCLQSCPGMGSLPMSWRFASHGHSIGASVSVLPMNIQGWFPLGMTDVISLQSKGLSRAFHSTNSKASILRCSAFFMDQLSHPYITGRKIIALPI